MDDQIKLLALEIGAVEQRISKKLSDLDDSVRALQIADGAKGAIEHRMGVAEKEIHMLFENHRRMEEKYDEKLESLTSAVATKVAFWKGAAWLASGAAAFALVMVDIALRLYK